VRIRLELDTNDDGRPDVVQHLDGDSVARQDEDSDFDGTIDRSFEGKKAVPVEGKPKAPPKLGDLDCGEFDRFWKVHGG